MNSSGPVLCIAGPTAAGKTDLAIALAASFEVDIVSVDSAMVYRGLDIGTAKPSVQLLEDVPHALIDIREPWENYSAGDFCQDATALIQASLSANRLPLLVGGTLLYFRSLQRGLARLPAANLAVREMLDEEAAGLGWPAMHAALVKIDPRAAARIDPNDRQRIQRALEVHRLTGICISELQARSTQQPAFEFASIALVPADRAVLNARIESRFDRMMEAGFLDEVKTLRRLPKMHAGLSSAKAVGYRQLWQYLDGRCDLARAREDAVLATRRYAKRQLTWLRGEPSFRRVDCLRADGIDQVVAILREAGVAGAL